MSPTLEKLFGFDSQKHNVRTEIMAGITTFLTMAYILAVNPTIFSDLPDMPVGSAFTATALACLGTSTTTTYVESASGVGEGGRTGLTAFSTAICFALALFLSPLFLAIPGAATAPALIIVGVMMMPVVADIQWDDYCKAVPAFMTIIMMPLAYSISDGILIGVISYVGCHAVTGKFKDISITMWVLALLFVSKYIFI